MIISVLEQFPLAWLTSRCSVSIVGSTGSGSGWKTDCWDSPTCAQHCLLCTIICCLTLNPQNTRTTTQLNCSSPPFVYSIFSSFRAFSSLFSLLPELRGYKLHTLFVTLCCCFFLLPKYFQPATVCIGEHKKCGSLHSPNQKAACRHFMPLNAT